MEDWEKERIPESNETENRFSTCLQRLTNSKYYVGVVGRGVKGIDLPPECTEYIDYALIRSSEDSDEFLGFIDIVGRNLTINSFPDFPVRKYKGDFAKKVLEFRLPTFIVQEMKLENTPLPNRYIWVLGSTVIECPISRLIRRKGEPQCNHDVPRELWHRGISTFIAFIVELPDLSDLFSEYKGDILVFPAYAGIDF